MLFAQLHSLGKSKNTSTAIKNSGTTGLLVKKQGTFLGNSLLVLLHYHSLEIFFRLQHSSE